MSLKRFAIRTKKSLSGLYSPNIATDHSLLSPVQPEKEENFQPKTSPDVSPGFDEFGFHRGTSSPSRDSPSKRFRFIGSLRKYRSENGNNNNNHKTDDNETSFTPTKPLIQTETPQRKSRPALKFEGTPLDQPMFEPGRNVSSSSESEVYHSSPIAVPSSAKQIIPNISSNTPPNDAVFRVGTVPESPAPLQKASVQESIISHRRPGPIPKLHNFGQLSKATRDPNLTPMPGSNLPLEEPCHSDKKVPCETIAPGRMRLNYSYFPPSPDPMVDSPRIDSINNSIQVPKSADKVRGTVNGRISQLPEDIPLPDPDGESFVLDEEMRRSLQNSTDCASAYLAVHGPESVGDDNTMCNRRRNTWGRHTGLYDGSGYDEVEESIAHEAFSPPPRMVNGLVKSAQECMISSGESAELDLDKTGTMTGTPKPRMRRPTTGLLNINADDPAAGAPARSEIETVPVLDTASDLDREEHLQDIISAYGRCPMFFDDEIAEEPTYGSSGSPSQHTEESGDSVEGDVALSDRTMNPSLGG
ncbi:hypothetical protein BCR34DRAFT_583363 [Clohesyomyces aquaticus]|uniref:Uncharacterized protein n=1 Tax=Clohesyomyces aquaticus TaxID=1231657 RepID=A0A1Y2A657_9PLEO|nr:hypothetical protein BCR34DRAFT_583363 [Clohesyomyces aquaticus]